MSVHYRILRDRSSRDDDALIAPILVAGTPWSCSVCGEENADDDLFCGWCSSRNGDWLCDRDGHKNPSGADECEECGSPKPDED